MAQEITQRELRNDTGEIMRRLDRGEEFVVTRDGVPVAELKPPTPPRFVPAETAIAIFRDSSRIDHARFREDLDRVLDQDPTAPA